MLGPIVLFVAVLVVMLTFAPPTLPSSFLGSEEYGDQSNAATIAAAIEQEREVGEAAADTTRKKDTTVVVTLSVVGLANLE